MAGAFSCTNNLMKIVWDEHKRIANLQKHGLDFDDVYFFDWDTALITKGHSNRLKAVGRYDDGTAVVIYATLGTEATSIISFRTAGEKERKAFHDSLISDETKL